MSKKGYAERPYRLGGYDDERRAYSIIAEPTFTTLAYVMNGAGIADLIKDAEGENVGVFSVPRVRERQRATAHLFTAAPDLLEALERLLESYTDLVNSGDCGFWNPEEEEIIIAARAAISKATGGE